MNDKSSSAPKGEKLLYTEKVLGQYKLFYIDYKENKRGRFLKVTEKDGRFRSTIIIPEEALEDFGIVVNKVIQEHQAFCESLPPEDIPAESHAPDSNMPVTDEPEPVVESQNESVSAPDEEPIITDGPDHVL